MAFSECDTSVEISNNIHTNITVAKYPFVTITTGTKKFYDMNLLFNSCHACMTPTNLVVSFVKNDTLLPVSYLPTDLDTVGDNAETVYNIECLANGSTFGGKTITFIDNCAKVLGRVITSVTFHCVQCKPGFYPERDAGDSAFITSCTAFSNC